MSDAIDWLFARGHAADVVLAVLIGEWAWLVLARRWPLAVATFRLLPAALLIAALRAALLGAAWPWVALPLAAAFPPHLADLALDRARRSSRAGGRRAISSP